MTKTTSNPKEKMRMNIELADNGIIIRNPDCEDDITLAVTTGKFHEGFDHSELASELRKANKTTYEVTPDASVVGIEIYYIMEQKNGEMLIVYGHYDEGIKENEIRFIFSIAP